MKRPGYVLSLGEKAIEDFCGFGSSFSNHFNILAFNGGVERHRHMHITRVTCSNNQNIIK